MIESSTREHKSANLPEPDVHATGGAVGSDKTKPAIPRPEWYGPTAVAKCTLSAILHGIVSLDLEEDETTSDALRIVSVASDVADRLIAENTLNQEHPENAVAGAAFDTQALLIAALHYPKQRFGFERTALLNHAISILDVLTDMLMSGSQAATFVPALQDACKLEPRGGKSPKVLALSGCENDGLITRDTELPRGGKTALDLVLDCCYDIEPLADHLINSADELRAAGHMTGAPSHAFFRMLGTRIKELNSVVMSYLGEDTVTLAEAHHSYVHGAFHLPTGELS